MIMCLFLGVLSLSFRSFSSHNNDLVAPLVDSPAKTIGSDFNGDGIHDIAMDADLNNDGATDGGAVYILYGAGSLSSTYQLNGEGVNVTIIGKGASDSLGRSLKSAGDVNSDGFDDLIMGAPLNNDGPGANDAGAAYILYGHPSLSADYDLNGNGVDITILGKAAVDRLGNGVSGAGDINGDGFDDILVGANGNDDAINNGGAVYILYGSASLSADYRMDGTGANVTILGKGDTDYLGIEGISSAGDVNADGFDDLIVGAYGNSDLVSSNGAAYLLFGSSSLSADYRIGGAGVNLTLLGGGSIDGFGRGASGIGDINNDGFHDFAASSHLNDNSGGTDAGAAYIMYGRLFEANRTIQMTTEGPNLTIIGVTTAQDRLGRWVTSAGDINEDGFHDIVTGASDTGTVDNQGAGYIIYGSTSLASQINAGNNDVTITGKANGDGMGLTSSGLGDVNNDGFPDVAFSAIYNNDGATDGGAVYIIFGGESISASFLVAGSGPNVTILGKAASDRFGRFIGGGRGGMGP